MDRRDEVAWLGSSEIAKKKQSEVTDEGGRQDEHPPRRTRQRRAIGCRADCGEHSSEFYHRGPRTAVSRRACERLEGGRGHRVRRWAQDCLCVCVQTHLGARANLVCQAPTCKTCLRGS